MHFLTIILRHLRHRLTRTALTISGLAIAIGAVVSLVGIAQGLQQSFVDHFQGQNVDIAVYREGVTDRTASSLQPEAALDIQKISGVRLAEPVLFDTLSLEEGNAIGVTAMGIDPASPLVATYDVIAGRSLQAGDQRAVVLGFVLANDLKKKAGDQLEILEGRPYEVVGIMQSESVMNNGMLIMPLAELQELNDRQGQVTNFQVQAKPGATSAEIDAICQQIIGLKQGLAAMPSREFVETDPKMRLARAMAWITSSIAIMIGGIGMLNTMTVSVFERTKEIGILRAIGWRRRRVVTLVLSEAFVLSLIGATVGVLGGMLLTFTLSRLPGAANSIAGTSDPWLVVQGYIIAVIVGVTSAAYPAFQASQLAPTEALRHE